MMKRCHSEHAAPKSPQKSGCLEVEYLIHNVVSLRTRKLHFLKNTLSEEHGCHNSFINYTGILFLHSDLSHVGNRIGQGNSNERDNFFFFFSNIRNCLNKAMYLCIHTNLNSSKPSSQIIGVGYTNPFPI